MPKVYPHSWPNRHLLPAEEHRIGLELVNAYQAHCESGIPSALLQTTGTFRQTTKAQVRPYVIRWLIALSNRLQVPVWAWAGENIPSFQPKAHFHSIIFIPKKIQNLKTIENTWKEGIMETQEYNPQQLPYNFIEYIVGKHDFMPIQNPIMPSLAQGRRLLTT